MGTVNLLNPQINTATNLVLIGSILTATALLQQAAYQAIEKANLPDQPFSLKSTVIVTLSGGAGLVGLLAGGDLKKSASLAALSLVLLTIIDLAPRYLNPSQSKNDPLTPPASPPPQRQKEDPLPPPNTSSPETTEPPASPPRETKKEDSLFSTATGSETTSPSSTTGLSASSPTEHNNTDPLPPPKASTAVQTESPPREQKKADPLSPPVTGPKTASKSPVSPFKGYKKADPLSPPVAGPKIAPKPPAKVFKRTGPLPRPPTDPKHTTQPPLSPPKEGKKADPIPPPTISLAITIELPASPPTERKNTNPLPLPTTGLAGTNVSPVSPRKAPATSTDVPSETDDNPRGENDAMELEEYGPPPTPPPFVPWPNATVTLAQPELVKENGDSTLARTGTDAEAPVTEEAAIVQQTDPTAMPRDVVNEDDTVVHTGEEPEEGSTVAFTGATPLFKLATFNLLREVDALTDDENAIDAPLAGTAEDPKKGSMVTSREETPPLDIVDDGDRLNDSLAGTAEDPKKGSMVTSREETPPLDIVDDGDRLNDSLAGTVGEPKDASTAAFTVDTQTENATDGSQPLSQPQPLPLTEDTDPSVSRDKTIHDASLTSGTVGEDSETVDTSDTFGQFTFDLLRASSDDDETAVDGAAPPAAVAQSNPEPTQFQKICAEIVKTEQTFHAEMEKYLVFLLYQKQTGKLSAEEFAKFSEGLETLIAQSPLFVSCLTEEGAYAAYTNPALKENYFGVLCTLTKPAEVAQTKLTQIGLKFPESAWPLMPFKRNGAHIIFLKELSKEDTSFAPLYEESSKPMISVNASKVDVESDKLHAQYELLLIALKGIQDSNSKLLVIENEGMISYQAEKRVRVGRVIKQKIDGNVKRGSEEALLDILGFLMKIAHDTIRKERPQFLQSIGQCLNMIEKTTWYTEVANGTKGPGAKQPNTVVSEKLAEVRAIVSPGGSPVKK